jgi:hypothetical protein
VSDGAAVSRLCDRLRDGPRRVADLFAEGCGGSLITHRDGVLRRESGRDGTNGHTIATLNEARVLLGVAVETGPDGRWWWQLPPAHEEQPGRPIRPCPACGARLWWRNHYDWWLCGYCHVPTLPEMVMERREVPQAAA